MMCKVICTEGLGLEGGDWRVAALTWEVLLALAVTLRG
jgi:hypothetical protein